MSDDDKQTVKRRDEALRRALSTPPKPKQKSGEPKEPRPSTKKPATPTGES